MLEYALLCLTKRRSQHLIFLVGVQSNSFPYRFLVGQISVLRTVATRREFLPRRRFKVAAAEVLCPTAKEEVGSFGGFLSALRTGFDKLIGGQQALIFEL